MAKRRMPKNLSRKLKQIRMRAGLNKSEMARALKYKPRRCGHPRFHNSSPGKESRTACCFWHMLDLRESKQRC